ncbi:hypothetical protein [Kitasatospora cineracea]|uniref:hypothetical protein n=1 Tax=Kitasatospora cineracea TaxID=88074 RepID=UPI00378CD7B5
MKKSVLATVAVVGVLAVSAPAFASTRVLKEEKVVEVTGNSDTRSPQDIAVDPALHRAYVTNYGNSTVTVVDTAARAQKVVRGVGIVDGPGGIGVDTELHRIVVAGTRENAVTIAAGDDAAKIAVVPVGGYRAFDVAVDSKRHLAYVLMQDKDGGVVSAGAGGNALAVIDVKEGKRLAVLPIDGPFATDVVVDPERDRVYANQYGALKVWESSTRKPLKDVKVDRAGTKTALNTANGRIYTVQPGERTVTSVLIEIDPAGGKTRTWDTDDKYFDGIAADPATGRFYVAGSPYYNSGFALTSFDPATGKSLGKAKLPGDLAHGVAVDPAAKEILVATCDQNGYKPRTVIYSDRT